MPFNQSFASHTSADLPPPADLSSHIDPPLRSPLLSGSDRPFPSDGRPQPFPQPQPSAPAAPPFPTPSSLGLSGPEPGAPLPTPNHVRLGTTLSQPGWPSPPRKRSRDSVLSPSRLFFSSSCTRRAWVASSPPLLAMVDGSCLGRTLPPRVFAPALVFFGAFTALIRIGEQSYATFTCPIRLFAI